MPRPAHAPRVSHRYHRYRAHHPSMADVHFCPPVVRKNPVLRATFGVSSVAPQGIFSMPTTENFFGELFNGTKQVPGMYDRRGGCAAAAACADGTGKALTPTLPTVDSNAANRRRHALESHGAAAEVTDLGRTRLDADARAHADQWRGQLRFQVPRSPISFEISRGTTTVVQNRSRLPRGKLAKRSGPSPRTC